MSDIFQKLLQVRAEPSPEAKWPRWIAEALVYEAKKSAPAESSPKAIPAEADERRNIRVLTRVLST